MSESRSSRRWPRRLLPAPGIGGMEVAGGVDGDPPGGDLASGRRFLRRRAVTWSAGDVSFAAGR